MLEEGCVKRYQQAFDGVPLRLKVGEVFATACCDCLLVHKRRITRRGAWLFVRAWRYPQATSALRRHRKAKRT